MDLKHEIISGLLDVCVGSSLKKNIANVLHIILISYEGLAANLLL